MRDALAWSLPLVALGFFAHAGRTLAVDARAGYDVGMGAAGQFSGEWLIGSAAGAWGLTLALGVEWYWGVALFVALYALKSVAYRLIVSMNLGKEAPPPPKDGFKDFLRRAEQIDASKRHGEGSGAP